MQALMDSETFATLKAYPGLADQLAEHATKEELAERRLTRPFGICVLREKLM